MSKIQEFTYGKNILYNFLFSVYRRSRIFDMRILETTTGTVVFKLNSRFQFFSTLNSDNQQNVKDPKL